MPCPGEGSEVTRGGLAQVRAGGEGGTGGSPTDQRKVPQRKAPDTALHKCLHWEAAVNFVSKLTGGTTQLSKHPQEADAKTMQ